MGQTGGFAASSWLVRQVARHSGVTRNCHENHDSREDKHLLIDRGLQEDKIMATRVRSLVAIFLYVRTFRRGFVNLLQLIFALPRDIQ